MKGSLRPVNALARSVLQKLADDLKSWSARTIDNTDGAFMAVHVERIGETPVGAIFSVAHYFEQNGDLVPDPDVTFLRDSDGQWYPLSYQDSLFFRQSAEVDPDGLIVVQPTRQSTLVDFANFWLRNIGVQQHILENDNDAD